MGQNEGTCDDCQKPSGVAAFFWRWASPGPRIELCRGCVMRLLGAIIRWKKGTERDAKAQARSGT